MAAVYEQIKAKTKIQIAHKLQNTESSVLHSKMICYIVKIYLSFMNEYGVIESWLRHVGMQKVFHWRRAKKVFLQFL